MPGEVPQEFHDEPEYIQFTLWRDVSRSFEDYKGARADWLRVVKSVVKEVEEMPEEEREEGK